MARFAVGLVFGVVVGVVGGAAAGLHAQDEGDTPDETVVVDASEPAPDIWTELAECESTSRWSANTGNSYFGGLQMDLPFWRRHGGLAYAARPDLASRAAQIAVAERGLAVQGWQAWPACSRRLGLR